MMRRAIESVAGLAGIFIIGMLALLAWKSEQGFLWGILAWIIIAAIIMQLGAQIATYMYVIAGPVIGVVLVLNSLDPTLGLASWYVLTFIIAGYETWEAYWDEIVYDGYRRASRRELRDNPSPTRFES